MTDVKPPAAYRSGFCSVGRHDRCRGDYRTAVCDCPCHTGPPPEVPGETTTILTDLAVTAAAERQQPVREPGRSSPAVTGHACADVAPDPDGDGLEGIGRLDTDEHHPDRCGGPDIAWGAYEPAIRRWEHVLGRLAPPPTETGPKGAQRLSAAFVEWLMGLPAGWVTAVPGLSRNEKLKALGNGVVPQQCAAALRLLLPGVAS